MPQMAPISWLILFLTFSLVFMIFNMMNYFSFTPLSPKSSTSLEISSKSFNWKW